MTTWGDPREKLMKESDLQTAIVDAAEHRGWLVYWLPDWLYKLAIQSMARRRRGDREWSPPGFPDLVLCQGLMDSRTPVRLIFMELKSKKGTVRFPQQRWMKALRRIPGVEVYAVRPSDWLDGTVDRILDVGALPDHPGTLKELERIIHEPQEG